jgi:3-oxoacyl-[acyl-carrier protein] reductase
MNIVVTGASRGIGYELVKILSADTNNTVIAIARNVQGLEQLKKDCLLQNSSSKLIVIPCDLNNITSVNNFISELPKHIPSINILINNAGAIVNKPFNDITTADLEYIYNVNVFSLFRLIQGVLPIFDKSKKSHVVNISSMGGFQGSAKFAGLSAYSSSKAALACLTECLAEEFKEKNIAFNCLALGAAQTEMLNEAFPGYKAPLTANQMAGYIASFALTAHHIINGKIIPVSMGTP